MSFELSSAQHVMITGAAGAIGSALARALRARASSARFTLVDHDAVGVGALARELGGSTRAAVWDLAHPDELPKTYEEATRDMPVDALVNCAGISMELRSFAGTPWALGSRLLNIDVVSPMRLMNLAIPGMRARASGLVVNLASLAGVLPLRGSTFYGAAKAGLAAASEIARIELAPGGISVLTVYPGPISSGLERRARAQVPSSLFARWLPVGDSKALAARIVRAVETGAARLVYPPVYSLATSALGLARIVTERWSPDPFE